MDFFAAQKKYAGFWASWKQYTGPRLDGVGGALRLLADVALKTLVSNRVLPEETKRGTVFNCWLKAAWEEAFSVKIIS